MPNIGDIIRASDIAVPKGIVAPFYNVTLSGRFPIFWGDTEADTSWLVCDGGDDLHGGNVPDLRNRFIMGVVSVDEANKTGDSSDVTVDNTTLTVEQMPNHNHSLHIWSDRYNNYPYKVSQIDPGVYNSTHDSRFMSYTGGSQSHTHSFSGTLTPPYYSLIYLVKLP